MKHQTPPPATTSAQRQRKRRRRLDALAKGNGFESFTKLETALLLGTAVVIRLTPTKKNSPGATTMDARTG